MKSRARCISYFIRFWNYLNICGQVDTFICGINVNMYSQGKAWKGSENARKRSECQLKGHVVILFIQKFLYGWLTCRCQLTKHNLPSSVWVWIERQRKRKQICNLLVIAASFPHCLKRTCGTTGREFQCVTNKLTQLQSVISPTSVSRQTMMIEPLWCL